MSTKLTKWLKSCSSFLGLPNKIRGILTANFLTRFHCSVPSGFFLLPFYQNKAKIKNKQKTATIHFLHVILIQPALLLVFILQLVWPFLYTQKTVSSQCPSIISKFSSHDLILLLRYWLPICIFICSFMCVCEPECTYVCHILKRAQISQKKALGQVEL